METPSSTRMATISQASVGVVASSQKVKKEDQSSSSSSCYLSQSRSKASSLVDITNDSPIVGLANGKTPSSSIAKNRVRVKNTTPGSGEAILRGQVKTLLQKVEEEAEFVVNKNKNNNKNQQKAMVNLPGPSPIQLLAPTPMNTPQLPGGGSEFPLQDSAPIQIAEAVGQKECLINRALLFDSPDKSDAASVSSAVTYQGSEIEHKSPEEDDSSSAWSSIQVNVEDDEEDDEDAEDYEEEEEEYEEGFYELCEGLSKMTVEEEEGVPHLPEFTGKLTRFVYNSDDEIEGTEVVVKEKMSPSVMVLKGLPVPEGKHLRFQDDE